MIPGAPDEARWVRSEPRRILPVAALERMVQTAFPQCRIVEALPLTDGQRNANFKLRLNSTAEWIVLRIYEHDVSLCQKEIGLIRLIGGSVPVPEVIHSQPGGLEELPPFSLLRYVEGISFRELMRGGHKEAIAQAAHSAGETLAAIGRITFPKPGWLGAGLTVTAPLLEGVDPTPRFIDLCLESTNLQQRMPAELRNGARALAWAYASRLARLDADACLVHGDFGKRNLLVRQVGGRWVVAAVLDWEFAVSGSQLGDLGHFLRYESAAQPVLEPHFTMGYVQAGGALPLAWQRLARVVDLTALCESLTHDELPDTVVRELVELITATVDDRDPQFR